ncbi:Protein of unknown function [Ectothiorhodospira magna]|uniref:DUF2726 domain-containing protein n=1 Tax=Ectothiorhodospira magna TaxID=867345 RepID=A0A1H9AFX3_9GAMM|nr:DUF2726 domain-containing protein [Ectothiorhodospira magna]SEP75397.1 Protein of unknown function [Ectothiorhodospira magna]
MVEFSLVVLFLIAALLFYQYYNARASLPAPRPDCYGKSGSVLNGEEKALFKALTEGLGADHHVFPKVMAANVLTLKPNPDQPLKEAARRRIAHEYFDFVLCKKSDQTVTCVLRMQAAGRGLTALHDSNVFLGSVCEQVELPYAVIPTRSGHEADTVKAQVEAAITANQARIQAKAKAKAEAKARAEAKRRAKSEAKARAEAKARTEAEARAAQKAAARTPAAAPDATATQSSPDPEPAASSGPMPRIKAAPESRSPSATRDQSSSSASRTTRREKIDVVSTPASAASRKSRPSAGAKGAGATARAKRTPSARLAPARPRRNPARRGPGVKKD